MTTVQDTLDLTTVEGVKALMASSKNEAQWNQNCDQVKAANKRWNEKRGEFENAYPDFWYSAIVLSGFSSKVSASW